MLGCDRNVGFDPVLDGDDDEFRCLSGVCVLTGVRDLPEDLGLGGVALRAGELDLSDTPHDDTAAANDGEADSRVL